MILIETDAVFNRKCFVTEKPKKEPEENEDGGNDEEDVEKEFHDIHGYIVITRLRLIHWYIAFTK